MKSRTQSNEVLIGLVAFAAVVASFAFIEGARGADKPAAESSPATSASASASASASPPASASASATQAPQNNDEKPKTAKDIFDDEDCDDRLVFCMDEKGDVFKDVESIPTLTPDETLKIKAIGPASEKDPVMVSANGTVNVDTLARIALKGDLKTQTSLTGQTNPSKTGYTVIAEGSITATKDMKDIRVQLRDAKGNAKGKNHTIPINKGRYYLDVGLLVPVVLWGQREYRAVPLPGSSDQIISRYSDTLVTTAVALNIYFKGRPKGEVFHKAGFREWCGLQLGIDLEITAPRQGYLGFLIEPVTGVAFSFGGALVHATRLAEKYQQGMLLPPNGTRPRKTRSSCDPISASPSRRKLSNSFARAPPTLRSSIAPQ